MVIDHIFLEKILTERIHWVVLALLSALLGAFGLLLKKKGLEHEHSLEYLGVFKVFEFLIMLPLVFFIPFNFPLKTYLLMFLVSIFITVGLLIQNKGFKRLEFTKSIPLLSVKTIVTLFASMIVLDEFLTYKQLFGMGLVLFGLYKIESEHSLRETFKSIISSKGTVFTILAMIILGVTIVYEKQLILQTHIISYLVIMYFFSIINTLIILTIMYDGYHGIINGIKKEGKIIFGSAFFSAISNLLFVAALTVAYVALLEVVKKSSSIIAMVIGGKYFSEKEYLSRIGWTVFIIIGLLFFI